MTQAQKEALQKKVSDILFDQWDPIGINDAPTAPRTEYAGYAPQLVQFVQKISDDPWDVATELREIEFHKMSLDRTINENLDVARQLIQVIKGFEG